jgi:hypothetical protein
MSPQGMWMERNVTIAPVYGLAKENPQWPGVLNLSSESKISRSKLFVDLKAQSIHCDKSRPDRIFKRLKSGI